jgi:2-oxoglutarate dehydrogenase E1 component
MLLPHGFEGQGPDHSSARLERFLQLSTNANWRVMNCTTPANLFHALRGQIHSPYRKPLVIMTPKSLLRHKAAVSSLSDIATGSSFKSVIADTPEILTRAKRHVFCSGKVYYELLDKRQSLGLDQGDAVVSINRVEQLYPFPFQAVADVLKDNPGSEVIWCQEEPSNMGAWTFVDRRLENVMQQIGLNARPGYAGRSEASSPATGHPKRHTEEQEKLLMDALVNACKGPF